MQTIPGKLDCTRINRHRPSLFVQIVLIVTFIVASSPFFAAQTAAPEYPELARLGPSSYCNPFFGFRLVFPANLKAERLHFPVQPSGRHMLLALHLTRLDRPVEFFITAFEDSAKDPAALAAKARAHSLDRDKRIFGPTKVSVHGHTLYRVHILDNSRAEAGETSYYLNERGYVIRLAVFSHDYEMSKAVEATVEHMKFAELSEAACEADAPPGERIFYGPALPTDLVESTILAIPGASIPSGEFSGRSFHSPSLGLHVDLPSGWQPLPIAQAYRVIELMRDPTADPESTDRRRNLFRACASTLFAATDPRQEITSEVHPGLAVVAMPQGCVPDLIPPTSAADHEAAAEFATVMARSLGVTLVSKWHIRTNAQGLISSHLDGALPYHVPGEPLARRISLRVSAVANGTWIILIYSVAPSAAAEREIESRIHFTVHAADPPK